MNKYSASYSGATDTRGSRIIVRTVGPVARRQKSYSFNHAARDAFVYAVAQFAEVDESLVERARGEGNADRRIYTVLEFDHASDEAEHVERYHAE